MDSQPTPSETPVETPAVAPEVAPTPVETPVTTPDLPEHIAAPVEPTVAPEPLEQAIPTLDPLAKQTHVTDIIRDIEGADAKVQAWLGSHVDVTDIRSKLADVRAALAKEIGLAVSEAGHLTSEL